MSKPRRIILLEDDPNQAGWLAEEYIWEYDPDIELKYYDSESSFFKAIEEQQIQEWQPDFALIDLMVRFYSPTELAAMEQTPNFDELPDAKVAGVRCRNKLLEACPSVKVVIVTVLDFDPKTIPKDCRVLQKGSEELANEVSEFLKR